MCAQFTDDDVGKTVVNADGEEVGIVSEVQHGTAHVEPEAGLTDTIKAKLGWGGTQEEAYPLQDEAVETITDDEIRLSGDLAGGDTHESEREMGDTHEGGVGDTHDSEHDLGDNSQSDMDIGTDDDRHEDDVL